MWPAHAFDRASILRTRHYYASAWITRTDQQCGHTYMCGCRRERARAVGGLMGLQVPIAIEDLLAEMALQLGSLRALSMVLNHPKGGGRALGAAADSDKWALPISLYLRYTKAEEYVQKKAEITADLVSILDSYLWSKRSDVLSPALRALVEHEIEMNSSNGGSGGKIDLEIDRDWADLDRAAPQPPVLEDPAINWGVPTRMAGTCAVCTLKFTDCQNEATVVFPCGHAFHAKCVPEGACPLCFYASKAKQKLGARGGKMTFLKVA